jgi:formamidopyrimidine-DNA glycosylase
MRVGKGIGCFSIAGNRFIEIMPELPEVEVTRLGLLPHWQGATIESVIVRHRGLRWPVPANLERQLQGAQVRALSRRSKYILAEVLRDNAVSGWLLLHLGMTGSLIAHRAPPAPGKHDHLDFVLKRGSTTVTVRYNDPRRFGAVLWHDAKDGPPDTHPLLQGLGVEPLTGSFSPDTLFTAWRGRSVAVKQALLAGDAVVGVGNIYASEALFRARIRPTRAAGRVTRAECVRLHAAIRQTLVDALEAGGSTLRDFRHADGTSGYFQLQYATYDREGAPCPTCAAPIKRIVQGQRSTFFCRVCQK